MHGQEASRRIPLVVQVVVILVMAALGVVVGLVIVNREQVGQNQATRPLSLPYQPRDQQEQAFIDQLRQPSLLELEAIRSAVAFELGRGAFPVYVAQQNLVLPPVALGDVVVIGLPVGVQWTGGVLHQLVLVLADPKAATPERALSKGAVARDPYCYPQSPVAAPEACTPAGLKPAAPKAMYGGLHLVTWAERARFAGVLSELPFFTPPEPVYYATQSVMLAPFLDDPANMPVIILAPGVQVTGGQLGRAWVVMEQAPSAVPSSRIMYSWAYDRLYWATITGQAEAVCSHLGVAVLASYPALCG
jgi:hypothetical protein